MGSVILIFAFTMSLVIDFVEKKMSPEDELDAKREIKENV
jgi:hypothetical protein